MKFLIDVCTSSLVLQAALRQAGHDVVSAVNIDCSATDDTLLALALAEERILITADKDFGEQIFVWRLPHGTVIRFVEMTVDDQIAAMHELLAQYAADLTSNCLITVSHGRIRVRR